MMLFMMTVVYRSRVESEEGGVSRVSNYHNKNRILFNK